MRVRSVDAGLALLFHRTTDEYDVCHESTVLSSLAATHYSFGITLDEKFRAFVSLLAVACALGALPVGSVRRSKR